MAQSNLRQQKAWALEQIHDLFRTVIVIQMINMMEWENRYSGREDVFRFSDKAGHKQTDGEWLREMSESFISNYNLKYVLIDSCTMKLQILQAAIMCSGQWNNSN